MPNRILKESTLTSPNLNKCSITAQDLYKRILCLVDDYGCCEANYPIIFGKAYSMCMDKVKIKDVEKWLEELLKNNLIKIWSVKDRNYLLLNGVNHLVSYTNEGKPTRHRRKTPEPPKEISQSLPDLASLSHPSPNPNPNPNPNQDKIPPNPPYQGENQSISSNEDFQTRKERKLKEFKEYLEKQKK